MTEDRIHRNLVRGMLLAVLVLFLPGMPGVIAADSDTVSLLNDACDASKEDVVDIQETIGGEPGDLPSQTSELHTDVTEARNILSSCRSPCAGASGSPRGSRAAWWSPPTSRGG
jgi:hypothetical protein